MRTKLRFLLAISLFFFAFVAEAQTPWRQVEAPREEAVSLLQSPESVLGWWTWTEEPRGAQSQKSAVDVRYLPDAQGEVTPWEVRPFDAFSEQLRAQYPELVSFQAQHPTKPNQYLWFSQGPGGVHASIWDGAAQEYVFMDPVKGTGKHLQYTAKYQAPDPSFFCGTPEVSGSISAKDAASTAVGAPVSLRTFRMVVAASGEYTTYHGGTVAGALEAINATLTRVNMVFVRDLSLKLELIEQTAQVIYTDATLDPFGNGDLNEEIDATLRTVVGPTLYDLGHLFHQGTNNGNAGYIGSLCQDAKKGAAFTSGANPEGERFDIDYVAHEIGHQLGGNHSFAYESEGTIAQVEPGSGTTIMSYAGLVGADNVAFSSSDYFHGISVIQIANYLNTQACGASFSTANNNPEITQIQERIWVPKATPFVLKGAAADLDDSLTYNWEQVDAGLMGADQFGPDNLSGPAFRSFPAQPTGTRYFPALSAVAQGRLLNDTPSVSFGWETLSDLPRKYQFLLTVRDNHPISGGIDQGLTEVVVDAQSGPFVVHTPASNVVEQSGGVTEILWSVAGTDRGLIQESKVSIWLSTNGGISFSTLLAHAVPNNGATSVVLPLVNTNQARIMVAAVDGAFFAVSPVSFTIQPQSFVLQPTQLDLATCTGGTMTLYTSLTRNSGFNGTIDLSVEGAVDGFGLNLSTAQLTGDDDALQLEVTTAPNLASGTYSVTLRASSGAHVQTLPYRIRVYNGVWSEVVTTSPQDQAADQDTQVNLTWTPLTNASGYRVRWSKQPDGSQPLGTTTTYSAGTSLPDLDPDTTYYWQVQPFNACSNGQFGSIYSFTTRAAACVTEQAVGLPKTISSAQANTQSLSTAFDIDLPIESLKVSVAINHTWLSDLVLTLISPAGMRLPLVSNPCDDGQNMNVVFADDGEVLSCNSTSPAMTGTIIPQAPLSIFRGTSLKGTWVLEVEDQYPQDGGSITAFKIEACVLGAIRPDADRDGVFDDGDDQCLGTPIGAEVNAQGCPVYRLPANHFSLTTKTQSCVDVADGRVLIQARSVLPYSAQLYRDNTLVKEVSFTSQYAFESLAQGTYTLCLWAVNADVTYEQQCFTVVIGAPQPLSVLTAASADGTQWQVALSGAERYVVTLNGQEFAAEAGQQSWPFKPGVNTLKINTDLPCQGEFVQEWYYSPDPVLHPNPAENYLNVYAPQLPKVERLWRILDLSGTLMDQGVWNPETDPESRSIPVAGYAEGIYVLELIVADQKHSYKWIKK